MAWMQGDDHRLRGGKRVIAADAGGAPTGVQRTGPVRWRARSTVDADSRRVVACLRIRGAAGLVDVIAGVTTAARSAWGDHLAGSANGAYVTDDEQGEIIISTAAGVVVNRVPYQASRRTGGLSVPGVSIGGRYVAATG